MDEFETLTDDQLQALIVTATRDRPALRAIHDAAAGVVDAEVLPEVDPPPVIASGIPADIAEPGFTAGGVPTFDSVRERITGRMGTAAGQRELDGNSLEEQVAARDEAGRRKLEEIRRSMK
ncbi:hypothetical protein ACNHUS_25060 [Actinomycetes bacterium M1A6_2h]